MLWWTPVMRSTLETLLPSSKILSTHFGLIHRQVHAVQRLLLGFKEGLRALAALEPLITLTVAPMAFTFDRQLWQVTVISPVEIHSGKPDNEGVSVHRGFGCDEKSPVRDWRLGWGFLKRDARAADPRGDAERPLSLCRGTYAQTTLSCHLHHRERGAGVRARNRATNSQ